MIIREESKLIYRFDSELVWIEPWGENSLRVRATKDSVMPPQNWALLEPPKTPVKIEESDGGAVITNGKISACLNWDGFVSFKNAEGKLLFEEFRPRFAGGLRKYGRQLSPILGGDYRLTASFLSSRDEKIYGMGGYQDNFLNLKGCTIDLFHRNSQCSVPFMLSDRGYGMLWNNPAIGRVVFGKNYTEWTAESTKALDYWITAGDTPKEILKAYTSVTGRVPMMPDFAMGYWQCKLRYRTQEELLATAREYKKRGLPISVIVIDFFHWPNQGDWKFDPKFFPDPKAMVDELKEMGIKLMVSVWPTVDKNSENYKTMLERGLFIKTDRGPRVTMQFVDDTLFFDATNPEAREYVWEKIKKNYFDLGIDIFWLDEAEPEYSFYEHDNYRYYIGGGQQVGNIYPLYYAKTFYDGMKAEGIESPINLIRSAWAGSQRYGALVWSGDIVSNFESLRNQISCGLNMGIAGIPWWNSDIGGFYGGDPDSPYFRELICRWFQFGAFCPVMRLHGDRKPYSPPIHGSKFGSGGKNEVWDFGDEAYEILKKYMFVRENLRPYIKKVMREAHENGSPAMRTLFYEFPSDKKAWEIDDEYMFGPDILVAPVVTEGARKRVVYLPEGAEWTEAETGRKYQGGSTIECDAPLSVIPVFIRDNADIKLFN